MDCLDVRRQLQAAAANCDALVWEHLQTCSDCARAFGFDAGFGQALAAALAIPVPVDLAAQLIAAQRRAAAAAPLRRRRAPRWLALAAAAALALALGIVQWRDAHSLPAQATAHVTAEHEAAALQARQPLPEARIEAAFDAHGLHLLAAPPSGIAYLANCSVGGSDGLHMVMDSSAGPVSVLYLRGRKVDACVDFHRDGLVGRIVPLADGALVMLAREDRDFDGIEAAWRNALEGPRTAARGTL